jgi:hypothetical protein
MTHFVCAAYHRSKPNVYEIHRLEVANGNTDRVLVRGYRSGTSWITNLAASGKLVVWTAQSPSLAKEGWVPGESIPGDLFVLDTVTGFVTKVVTKDESLERAADSAESSPTQLLMISSGEEIHRTSIKASGGEPL